MSSPNSAVAHLTEVLGENEAKSVVRGYLDHTSQQLRTLPGLSTEKQTLIVHGMKGSSSQVGATLFAAQCRAIESQLKDEKRNITAEEVSALQSSFTEYQESVVKWLR